MSGRGLPTQVEYVAAYVWMRHQQGATDPDDKLLQEAAESYAFMHSSTVEEFTAALEAVTSYVLKRRTEIVGVADQFVHASAEMRDVLTTEVAPGSVLCSAMTSKVTHDPEQVTCPTCIEVMKRIPSLNDPPDEEVR